MTTALANAIPKVSEFPFWAIVLCSLNQLLYIHYVIVYFYI